LGVVAAAVEAVFFNYANYATSKVNVKQDFKIVYIPNTVKISDFDTQYAKMLSGNPGYLRGKPILVANSNNINAGYLNYSMWCLFLATN
jgi:hypothetical protein